jgi:hypothetical protein
MNETVGAPKGPIGDLPKPHANVADGEGTHWRSLAVFNAYRLLVAAIFSFSSLLTVSKEIFPGFQPSTLTVICLGYLLITVLGFVGVSVHRPKFQLQLSTNVFIAIVFTLILVHAGGGLKSGLALMLIAGHTPRALRPVPRPCRYRRAPSKSSTVIRSSRACSSGFSPPLFRLQPTLCPASERLAMSEGRFSQSGASESAGHSRPGRRHSGDRRPGLHPLR